MDKKQLEEYRLKEQEITSLEAQIAEKERQAAQYEYGAVRGSNPNFPYQPMTFHVSGYNIRQDEKHRQRIYDLKSKLERRKAEAEIQRLEVQEWISSIDDTTVRLIFTYRYLDGLKQEKIGEKLHLDRSRISRKIDAYLKDAHKAQNNLL